MISNKELVLIELQYLVPSTKDPFGRVIYQAGNWVRDYAAVLKQFVAEEQIRVTKIPEVAQPVEPWKELGAVIEVVM